MYERHVADCLDKVPSCRPSATVVARRIRAYLAQGETKAEKILQNIYNANQLYIPIFTLAFGREADYDLVRKIATQNFWFLRNSFYLNKNFLKF